MLKSFSQQIQQMHWPLRINTKITESRHIKVQSLTTWNEKEENQKISKSQNSCKYIIIDFPSEK